MNLFTLRLRYENRYLKKLWSDRREAFSIFTISLIGLILRIYKLGKNSLWFDEIGVALAIQPSDFETLLGNVRSHVMAMPLDYVVRWVFSRHCLSEACLRFPSALWGSLTIPISFFLFRRLVDTRKAIISTLFLTLNPLHLYYSQELRFYSPLCFFYILSTLALLSATQKPVFINWLRFVLIYVVGSYICTASSLSFICKWGY